MDTFACQYIHTSARSKLCTLRARLYRIFATPLVKSVLTRCLCWSVFSKEVALNNTQPTTLHSELRLRKSIDRRCFLAVLKSNIRAVGIFPMRYLSVCLFVCLSVYLSIFFTSFICFFICRKLHAFIYDATVLEYQAGKDVDCRLITVGNWYAMSGYGIAFPVGSPWKNRVNSVILELQQKGGVFQV